MLYLFILAILFVAELFYFTIADRLNIIDKPNERSSHKGIILRGGGIIFSISICLWFLVNGLQLPWFMLGLLAISFISLADDVLPRSNRVRLGIHLFSVGCMLYQTGIFVQGWFWYAPAFIVIIGAINAFNFMDGINGITAAYSFTVLGGLYLINQKIMVVADSFILYLAMGNLVFAFFNFRKKARCFAGDVGSVSMAFCLLFLATLVAIKAHSIFVVLLFAVYGVDSVLTIAHRLLKNENIFKAHRQHLYQYVANELKWPHLLVSFIYMLLQALISLGVLRFWDSGMAIQTQFALLVFLCLCIAYVLAKWYVLKLIKRNAQLIS